ncbi:MAG: hypothetical protein ACHQIO_04505, partial [Nevskiales bacterium]
PINHLSVIDGSPALLGQGGVFVQAIPGLYKNASASMPRPRLRAADPACPVMLGAARRGGTSKAQQKRKATSKAEVSFLSAPYPCSSSPRRRGSSFAGFDPGMKHDKCASLAACVPTKNLGTHGTRGKKTGFLRVSTKVNPCRFPTPGAVQ